MVRYYLAYARQHEDDWQSLEGPQFEHRSSAGGRQPVRDAQG